MKNHLIYALLLLSLCSYSQVGTNKLSKTTEIKFVYQSKSSVIVLGDDVIMNTNLLAFQFPDLEKHSVKSETEKNLSTVPLIKFNKDEKQRLISIIYHANEIHECVYNVDKQRTKIKSSRNSKEVKELFKNVFKESYSPFFYTTIIDYDKMTFKIDFPSVSYFKGFNDVEKKVVSESTDIVSFENKDVLMGKELIYKTFIETNSELDKHIVPILLKNNDSGVAKLSSIYGTTELISVEYK